MLECTLTFTWLKSVNPFRLQKNLAHGISQAEKISSDKNFTSQKIGSCRKWKVLGKFFVPPFRRKACLSLKCCMVTSNNHYYQKKTDRKKISNPTALSSTEIALIFYPVNILQKFTVEFDLRSSGDINVCKVADLCSLFNFCAPKQIWNSAFVTSSKTWSGKFDT